MRSTGLLLHLTSLPGRFGIGDVGPSARQFMSDLAEMGQQWWQMLPVGPTGYADSPYQAHSSFAGNPLLISPQDLAADGLLTEEELAEYPDLAAGPVDYAAVIQHKFRLLAVAASRITNDALWQRLLDEFRERSAVWLSDYCLFGAIKEALGGKPWFEWPVDLALRLPAALNQARKDLRVEILRHEIWQLLFDRQWACLRHEAAGRGIGLIGDLPIFAAHDSADVWANQEQFQLDDEGYPTVVAGVPPDYFSPSGQRWGNPIYRWETMADAAFGWWLQRFEETFKRFDLVRVDHFRGFAGYWEIPAANPTAEEGRWVEAPGRTLLELVRSRHAPPPIIAEDLGVITDDVMALRDDFGLPGMRVLQFGFGHDQGHSQHHPDHHVENAVCYTGTHDNDTTVGWFWGDNDRHDRRRLNKERQNARAYLQSEGREINWDMVGAALGSVCKLAVVPAQDILGLGSEGRMNTPAVATGNWTWRLAADAFNDGIVERMSKLTAESGRA